MLGVATHVDVTASTPESVLDHAVDHFLVAEFHAVPHTIDVVWGVRHRFLSAGDDNLLVAGGQESMSNAPYYVYGMRNGVKLGDQKMVDGMIKDGLWCGSCDVHMGAHAEYTANKAGITRRQQDDFAAA